MLPPRPLLLRLGAACAAVLPLAALPSAAAAQADGRSGAAVEAIVYGGDSSFPPYEYLDPQGQPAGLNVDLIRAVARDRGWRVTVDLRPWPAVRRALQAGEIDVAAMYRSSARAREVDFAIAHELVYHEIFVRRGAPPVRALGDLAGRRVLVEADTYVVDALDALGLGAGVRGCESEPAALRALAGGEGDAAVVTQAVGRPFLERQALGEAIVATGPPVLLAEYALVTARGRPALVEALNEGVAAVKASGEFDRLYDRWIHPDRSAERARQAAWALAVAVAAVLAVVAWNAALRRRVAAQTEALRQELEARLRAQAALDDSERARRQSQKMEAIGRLAGGVAHDFNNILSAVVSYATFARERLAALGEETGDVDEILVASERATRLTRQLLAFSRATPMETQPVDLAATVAGLQALLQRLVGGHIRLATSLPSEPVVVVADPTQLEQVLLNLAANARDAMPKGGLLSFAVSTAPAAPAPAGGAPSAGADGLAVLTVTDTGVGMDEATRARIFEPFFTTKAADRGTGLGLATVFANVQKLGGRVEVRTAPGEGSTFVVTLPRSPLRLLAHPPQEAPARRAARPETILLVEDDEALRRAARTALERAGHRVFEAPDGHAAMAVADQMPRPTAAVMDVVLPRRGGARVAADLRERWPGLPVLFVSGYVGEDAELDLAAPHTAFLMKPCTPSALLEALDRLVGAARADGGRAAS